MARTTIFPTQEISYDFLFMDMVPAASIIPAPFALESGQTYAVQWGDTLFENLSVIDLADAGFTGGAIGNGSGFELPGNNEPFAIAYFADDTGGEIVVFFLDGSESQTITVYQESAESPIVLKDRTGTGIEYEGVEGVRVFDKAGNAHVFVPPVETEEKTVELDFSGGAMEVTPTVGKLLSKVGIPVPDGLSPENISEGIRIAGIDGALKAGGGGGMVPVVFTAIVSEIMRGYTANGTSSNRTLVGKFPLGSNIYGKYSRFYMGSTSNSSSTQTATTALSSSQADISEPVIQDGYISVSITFPLPTNSKYYASSLTAIFSYSIPGLYVKSEGEDDVVLYADEKCLHTVPSNTSNTVYVYNLQEVTRADLSRGKFEKMPTYLFYNGVKIREVLLPATLTDIPYCSLRNSKIETIDLSRHTFVPTLNSSGLVSVSTAPDNLKILVPAALYDEWIAAANWSTYASYIVPV